MDEIVEYALVVVKPDGVRKGLCKEVQEFFVKNGMCLVKSSTKKITKSVVGDIFTSKHNGGYYKQYMTSGEMVVYLFKGSNVFERCRVMKNKLREQYEVDEMIENICHTPESGNEYMEQLKFFFPEYCDGKHNLYCDMYCKVYADAEYDRLKEHLNNCQNKTNSKIIFVYGNEEFFDYRNNIEKYYSEELTGNWLFGIEYIVALGRDKLRMVGYYRVADISSIIVDNTYCYFNMEKILDIIKENGGIPVWGYNKQVSNIIEYFNKYSLWGSVVYHPLYSIKETELLRECMEERQMFTLGGSGGIHPGEYSISYALFEKFFTRFI